MNKQATSVIENKHFVNYVIMNKFGKLTLDQFDNMEAKDALMLYYYVINDSLVKMYGLDLLTKQEEEKANNDMFR